MPTSAPDNIHLVCQTILKLAPKSALDLGAGFGKYGVLLREYMDVWYGRLYANDWATRIDCVEGYLGYLTPLHYYVYSYVFPLDIRVFLDTPPPGVLEKYDLCYLGDVIEHFKKEEGLALLDKIPARYILLQTPNFETKTWEGRAAAPYGNDLDLHRSRFYPTDFEKMPGAKILCDGRLLLVLIDTEAR